jgi:sugar lactone lactonase YvrE
LTVESASIQEGLATVELSGQMMLGGECDDPRVAAQLEETALQFPEASQAAIFINGTPLKDVLSLKGEAQAPTPMISVKGEPGPLYEVVFSVLVGGEGVHYEGLDVPETLPWGPAAFTVAPDGTFWIADSVKNRLLHYNQEGEDLGAIALAGLVVGIGDVAASSSEVLALDIAAQIPKVLRLSQGGEVLAEYDLPAGLRLENGLTGIDLGQTGEILVELEGGGRMFQLIDAQGEYRPEELEGYAYGGGFTYLGANADGSFYVTGEEVISSSPIQVNQTVRYLDGDGEQLGIARAPLAEQLVYVAHSLAVGPDGAVYALITRSESVDIVRLNFYTELEPLQPR